MSKTDNTVKKQFKPGEQLTPFKPGQSGNPTGRPKGSRNKFGEVFLKDMLADWEENGADAIKTVRISDPSTYLRVASSLLPKELNINEGETSLERMLEQYSIDELDQLIIGLTTLGASQGGKEVKDEIEAGIQPDILH